MTQRKKIINLIILASLFAILIVLAFKYGGGDFGGGDNPLFRQRIDNLRK